MVEISETSDIIATATPRTLVILDERGFSPRRWMLPVLRNPDL